MENKSNRRVLAIVVADIDSGFTDPLESILGVSPATVVRAFSIVEAMNLLEQAPARPVFLFVDLKAIGSPWPSMEDYHAFYVRYARAKAHREQHTYLIMGPPCEKPPDAAFTGYGKLVDAYLGYPYDTVDAQSIVDRLFAGVAGASAASSE